MNVNGFQVGDWFVYGWFKAGDGLNQWVVKRLYVTARESMSINSCFFETGTRKIARGYFVH